MMTQTNTPVPAQPDGTVPAQPDHYAFITQLSPQTAWVFDEYLLLPFPFGEVLENKLKALRQSILDELALYFDIRMHDGQLELYFKKEQ